MCIIKFWIISELLEGGSTFVFQLLNGTPSSSPDKSTHVLHHCNSTYQLTLPCRQSPTFSDKLSAVSIVLINNSCSKLDWDHPPELPHDQQPSLNVDKASHHPLYTYKIVVAKFHKFSSCSSFPCICQRVSLPYPCGFGLTL